MSDAVFQLKLKGHCLKQEFGILKTQTTSIDLCVTEKGLHFWCKDHTGTTAQTIDISFNNIQHYCNRDYLPMILSFEANTFYCALKTVTKKDDSLIGYFSGNQDLQITPNSSAGVSFVKLSNQPKTNVSYIEISEEAQRSKLRISTKMFVQNCLNCINQKCLSIRMTCYSTHLLIEGLDSDNQIRHSGIFLPLNRAESVFGGSQPALSQEPLACALLLYSVYKQLNKFNSTNNAGYIDIYFDDRYVIIESPFGPKDEIYGDHKIQVANSKVKASPSTNYISPIMPYLASSSSSSMSSLSSLTGQFGK